MNRAAEPTDIFWENMALNSRKRLKRKLITYSVSILLLGIVFFVTLLLDLFINFLEDETDGGSNILVLLIWALTFGNSILVAVINLILRAVMRKLTAKERNKTYTDYNVDVSFKLFFTMFTNTAIIPLVTKPSKNNWFGVNGLVVDVYLNLILVSFVNPLFYHYNWTLLFKKLRICYEKRKRHHSKITQREANKLFEGTNFDIAKGYADINMILATTAFYTPLMPLLPIISISGLIFHFWLQKYFLFRKCKIPQHMGERLAMLASANIPLLMFIYSLGQFIFISALSDGANRF